MDEKEAEARPVMGTIFLVIIISKNGCHSISSNKLCLIPCIR